MRLRFLFTILALFFFVPALGQKKRRSTYYEEEQRKRRSLYEEEFSEGRESAADSPEPVSDPGYVLPFFSALDFGYSMLESPGGVSNVNTVPSNLYQFGIGLDVPFIIGESLAFLGGFEVDFRYPTYVNLKPGEPVFHLVAGPILRMPFDVFETSAAALDFVPALSYKLRRHEYTTGYLGVLAPEASLETKVKLTVFEFSNTLPFVTLRVSGFGIGSKYYLGGTKTTTGDNPGSASRLAFSQSGSMEGNSLRAMFGFAFQLGESPADNELLFGVDVENEYYSRLKQIETFEGEVLRRDGKFSSTTFLVTWRRSWATE